MSKLHKISLMSVLLGSCFYFFSFYYLDQPIAYYLHHHFANTSFLYLLSKYVTLLGDPRVALGFTAFSFMAAIFILIRQPQNNLANSLLLMAIAMLLAIFLESCLKYLLGRYRPELLFDQGLYGFHYLSHSFLLNSSPSGHTTRAFVLVTGFSVLWRRGTPLFVVLGLLVCLSRLTLEYHYLSDVIFGSLLGTLVTLWVANIYYSVSVSSSPLTLFER